LVQRAQDGDIDAYQLLVGRHQDLAFRVAVLIAGNPADAEDAAHDAVVKAFYALNRFRTGAPFRPWLLRIVANEARNRRRSSSRRSALAGRPCCSERDPVSKPSRQRPARCATASPVARRPPMATP
jgi:RNA polymerase sigma-70 factor (ECF subfamily)